MCYSSLAAKEYDYWFRRNEREYYFRDTDDEPMIENELYWQVYNDDYIVDDLEPINAYLQADEDLADVGHQKTYEAAVKELKEAYGKHVTLVQYLGDCHVEPVE